MNEIRIGIQFGLIYLPVEVADAQGFFAAEAKKAGIPDLKVTIQRFSGSPAVTDAVLSDNIDFGAFGTPGLLIAWEKTRGHQDVAGLGSLGANSFVLDTNKPEIKSLTDFTDNDQIAVPATTSPQAIVLRMAAEKFYGEGQYKRVDKLLVSMPHPDATAALLAGRVISGYMATAPFIAVLQAQRQDPRRVHVEGHPRRGGDRRHPRRQEEIRRRQSGGLQGSRRGARRRHGLHRQGAGEGGRNLYHGGSVEDAEERRARHDHGRLDRLRRRADRADEIRDLHGQDRRDKEAGRGPGRMCSSRSSGRARGADGLQAPRPSSFERASITRVSSRLDRARERGRDVAVMADEIFVEIPLRRIERPLGRGPFVERVRVRGLSLRPWW